jgi:selenocysteine-specific elongation factor
LDLGFSAFIVPVPDWLKQKEPVKLNGIEYIQFTLVDCPGHASLMKTVIGGASIIDLMILVVDCQKLI